MIFILYFYIYKYPPVCSSQLIGSYRRCTNIRPHFVKLILCWFFQLCTQIEQLEQENQGLKEGGAAAASSPPPNPTSSPVDGELLRLQAENSTLLKKMKGL